MFLEFLHFIVQKIQKRFQSSVHWNGQKLIFFFSFHSLCYYTGLTVKTQFFSSSCLIFIVPVVHDLLTVHTTHSSALSVLRWSSGMHSDGSLCSGFSSIGMGWNSSTNILYVIAPVTPPTNGATKGTHHQQLPALWKRKKQKRSFFPHIRVTSWFPHHQGHSGSRSYPRTLGQIHLAAHFMEEIGEPGQCVKLQTQVQNQTEGPWSCEVTMLPASPLYHCKSSFKTIII